MVDTRTAELRKTINKLLPTDQDIDAFCLDYYRNVHNKFSRGMDRVEKITRLLQEIEPDELTATLDRVAQVETAMHPRGILRPLKPKGGWP